jgi:CheY-like chemotaxis protein
MYRLQPSRNASQVVESPADVDVQHAATALIREKEKRTGRHIPIVAMTAHAMASDREQCMQAGMDGYVSKPVSASALLDLVAEISRREYGTVAGKWPSRAQA